MSLVKRILSLNRG